MDVPAGVTQEQGHTGLHHLPSAVLALMFLAENIQPLLSLLDREVEFCVRINRSPLVGHIYIFFTRYVFFCEEKSQFIARFPSSGWCLSTL